MSSVAQSSNDSNTEVYSIQKLQELRIEADDTNRLIATLVKGTAEIFGTELVLNKEVFINPSAKFAVFTWHGCIIKLLGTPESIYVGKETPMNIYANLSAVLDIHRFKAAEQSTQGPRILICGPKDVGKSSLVRILCSYAARIGYSPILVDIDVGQNSLSVPGTISAAVIDCPFDLNDSLCFSETSFLLHFGHLSPNCNMDLYLKLLERLAEMVNVKCENNDQVCHSGLIINCCGWTTKGGLFSIKKAVEIFGAEMVIVLDQERLYSELSQHFQSSNRKLCLLPKSPGVVERVSSHRQTLRNQMIRGYFYSDDCNLFPHIFSMSFDDIKIYQIGSSDVPDSCMPLGMKDDGYKLLPVPLRIVPSLVNHLLAVSWDSDTSKCDFAFSNIAAIVVLTGVDIERRQVTLLSPTTTQLPSNVFLYSDTCYIDVN